MAKTNSKNTGYLVIIAERCKGCGFCVEFCPKAALEVSGEFNEKGYHPPQLKIGADCRGCHLCQYLCPELAIFVKEKPDAFHPFE